ncbi:MAG TPA: Hsp70 family protein [Moraxellaceae bacterium]
MLDGWVRFLCALMALLLCGYASGEGAVLVIEPPVGGVMSEGVLQEAVGIETLGGVVAPILQKGCKLPCSQRKTFSTAEDNQDQITLAVFRGNSVYSREARSLGIFRIGGISPMPRGKTTIQVEFVADKNGISLSATDGNGKSRLVLTRTVR